jgi:type IV pilus assembly protein PilQ
MKNNGLGKEVEGTVVRIAKLSTLEAEEKQRTDLAIAQEKAQPKETVTRTLSYASAKDLIPTLKRFLTERGDVIADNRTNTLILTDIPEVIGKIDRLITTLDRKSLQVEIEARVVSASRSFARDIGIQLAASGLTGNLTLGGAGLVGQSSVSRSFLTPIFGPTGPSPLGANQQGSQANGLSAGGNPGASAPLTSATQPLSVNFPATAPTSGFSLLLNSGTNFALDAIITAAESKGVGKLLSRPKIITQNNVEASVKQGVKIPLQTTINNTISVQYIDVVLRLTVTPQITADGTIFLKTDIENTSIDPGIATVPGQFGLDTQAATTQVLVSNGGTVFFGGVVANINRVNQQEVPLLGSVPLVGNLFKHKSITSTTNELLFFITPRIVQS